MLVEESRRLVTLAHSLLAYRVTTEAHIADDLKQTGKSDDSRINIEQDHELKYWSAKFGVSREELQSAVAKAGPMLKNVRAHLQRRD